MKSYQLKESIEVYLENQDSIHFLPAHNQKQYIYNYDPGLVTLIKVLENPKQLNEVIEEVRNEHPHISPEDITNAISALEDDNLVYEVNPAPLESESYHRNKRQIDFLNEYNPVLGGSAIQEQLSNKKVVVLGLGGIGSWVVTSLAMAGINYLTILDGDVVEESNLTRQNLYTYDDINQKKVNIIKQKLKLMNKSMEIKEYDLFCDENTDLVKVFDGSDLVISCIDYPTVTIAGKWVSKAAQALNIPHIIAGGYRGHIGMIGPTIIPGQTICWECITDSLDEEYDHWKLIKEAKRIGSIGTLSSIIANLHVWESIRLLTGIEQPHMINKRGEFDFSNLDLQLFDMERNKHCEHCMGYSMIKRT